MTTKIEVADTNTSPGPQRRVVEAPCARIGGQGAAIGTTVRRAAERRDP